MLWKLNNAYSYQNWNICQVCFSWPFWLIRGKTHKYPNSYFVWVKEVVSYNLYVLLTQWKMWFICCQTASYHFQCSLKVIFDHFWSPFDLEAKSNVLPVFQGSMSYFLYLWSTSVSFGITFMKVPSVLL